MFQFTEDCRTGIKEIDAEHEYLFELLNRAYALASADIQKDQYRQLKDIIGELDNYAEQHFEHEEAYMEKLRDTALILQSSQPA
ncbi:MAG: hemerythrin domain-containing protein, partial [Acetatifactor sp.]|nr:hemerythrin domain-containing protein [Acetatifactor sp.]